MKQHLKTLAAGTAILLLPATAPIAGELNVSISGFPTGAGQARIVLLNGEDGYRGITVPVAIVETEITGGVARWTESGLPDGDYALIVYQDADGDGELNRPVFGIPTEPYGYSNGAWTSFGLPDWQNVRFSVAGARIEQDTRLRTNVLVTAAQVLAAGIPSLVAIFLALALVRRLRSRNSNINQLSEN